MDLTGSTRNRSRYAREGPIASKLGGWMESTVLAPFSPTPTEAETSIPFPQLGLERAATEIRRLR
jgi:hypothetical protein